MEVPPVAQEMFRLVGFHLPAVLTQPHQAGPAAGLFSTAASQDCFNSRLYSRPGPT